MKVDGAYVDADKKIRQGLVRDTNGELKLVVWMELTSEQPVEISFEKEWKISSDHIKNELNIMKIASKFVLIILLSLEEIMTLY